MKNRNVFAYSLAACTIFLGATGQYAFAWSANPFSSFGTSYSYVRNETGQAKTATVACADGTKSTVTINPNGIAEACVGKKGISEVKDSNNQEARAGAVFHTQARMTLAKFK